jgi:hypothetical protein
MLTTPLFLLVKIFAVTPLFFDPFVPFFSWTQTFEAPQLLCRFPAGSLPSGQF